MLRRYIALTLVAAEAYLIEIHIHILIRVILNILRLHHALADMHIKRLQRQFQSAMQSVSGALGAGYSLEYAWRYAQGDMQRLYGKDADIVREFAYMNRKYK